MDTTYYQPGRQRAAKVRELFDAIAGRYDLLNDVMSLGLHRLWKRRLVRQACPAGQSLRVLDLCCGTGDLALRLARRGARVVGADFTLGMLQVANRRGGSARPVPFVQADALKLPFADASFDVVTVGYGLRNLADLETGLREIQRVLRPGGRVLSLDFGQPPAPWWRKLYFAHLRFWVPVLGLILAGDRQAYAYILPSLENYPGQRGVQALLQQLGFGQCGFEEFVGGAMAINTGRKQP